MADNAKIIWSYLKKQGLTDAGVAGIMGNLYAESGLIPTNLQNTYEKRFNMTDAQYTAAVDNGTYTNFVHDKAGYGLAQWTYWSRKEGLYNLAKSKKKSIGDLNIQLEWLVTEMTRYTDLWQFLKTTTDVYSASTRVLNEFERPAKLATEADEQKRRDTRAGYGKNYFNSYAENKPANPSQGGTTMSNSPLVTYTNWSPNKNSPRNMPIDRISIHCFVGQVTAKRGSDVFKPASKRASCQYVVGKDGDVSQNVDEKDRSWCTSSSANDNRAITIEVASDAYHPYAVTAKAYAGLLDLCTDICKRNGKKKLLWIADKTTALNYKPAADEMVLTVHRWFAAKACPGQYLFDRQGAIAKEVTARLSGGYTPPTPNQPETPTKPAPAPSSYLVKVTATALNIRKSPTTASAITGCIRDKGTYTIVETQGNWGKLKSGMGWICLTYTKRV